MKSMTAFLAAGQSVRGVFCPLLSGSTDGLLRSILFSRTSILLLEMPYTFLKAILHSFPSLCMSYLIFRTPRRVCTRLENP